MSISSYKAFYVLYVAILFFVNSMLRAPAGIPFVFLGVSLAPLYFDRSFSLMNAIVWGIIMGSISYNNAWFFVCISVSSVLLVSYIIKRIEMPLMVFGLSSGAIAILYGIGLAIFGDYGGVRLWFDIGRLAVLFFVQAQVFRLIIYWKQ